MAAACSRGILAIDEAGGGPRRQAAAGPPDRGFARDAVVITDVAGRERTGLRRPLMFRGRGPIGSERRRRRPHASRSWSMRVWSCSSVHPSPGAWWPLLVTSVGTPRWRLSLLSLLEAESPVGTALLTVGTWGLFVRGPTVPSALSLLCCGVVSLLESVQVVVLGNPSDVMRISPCSLILTAVRSTVFLTHPSSPATCALTSRLGLGPSTSAAPIASSTSAPVAWSPPRWRSSTSRDRSLCFARGSIV